MEKDKKRKALSAITAWRQLDGLGLLNNVERIQIKEKIMAMYGKYLSPLRTKQHKVSNERNRRTD